MKTFKYSGSGNTFLIIEEPCNQVEHFCKIHDVDGIIRILDSDKADFQMRIFNSDGTEAEMCGNGMRCAVRYFKEVKKIEQDVYFVETMHAITKVDSQGVHFPIVTPKKIHIENLDGYFLNTGVPHAVFFVENIHDPKWMELAPAIRNHPQFFPSGTNVNFAKLGCPLKLRTYERGVEGETLSCGTGAVAVAISAYLNYQMPTPLTLLPKSEESLTVNFQKGNLILSGPTTFLSQSN